ncbi:MAG: hypothetical protein VR66_09140 [Peptococcaceae bacterium BRH_c23]|nr:MAG: hypothetical protein VR66_09140 [Peptococcaceae bacterium BRH_c23]KJS80708.1 MAG: hypothetical protein JL57_27690 [Desulfosporosinus sp. BICA1-9]HBW35655.1 hypothetical protein [Desulfosporosinus sp.]
MTTAFAKLPKTKVVSFYAWRVFTVSTLPKSAFSRQTLYMFLTIDEKIYIASLGKKIYTKTITIMKTVVVLRRRIGNEY